MEKESILKRFFLARYKNSSFLIQKKSSTLMYYTLSIMTLLAILTVVFAVALPEIFIQASLAIFTVIAGGIVTLVLLRRGYYYGAANLITSVAALAVTAGLFAKVGRDAYAGYTTYIYFMMGILVQATLLCRMRWVFGFALFFFTSDIAYFILVKTRLDAISLKAARVGVVDSAFTIALIFVLSYLITKITDEALVTSETESLRNLDNYTKIQKLLDSVKETSRSLAASAEDLASTSNSFSANSQTQAASAEEIMATIEEVSAGVDQVALGTNEQAESLGALVAKMSELSGVIVAMGGEIMKTVNLTGDISSFARKGEDSMSTMNGSMRKINEGSREMRSIIEIINTISDQINLLSLNATIEAARAGDYGRGFAVVADEISKLADRTASSLKEIDELINVSYNEIDRGIVNVQSTVDIISKIIEGVTSINTMMNTIGQQMKLQQEINGQLKNEADRVKNRSDQIKSATEEQKVAVTEIVKSIAGVNELTQSYSSGADKLSRSASSVEKMADSLRERVETFR